MYSLRSIDRRILKMSMDDTARNSMIAMPIISLFEIIMIVRWFLMGNSLAEAGSAAYLAGYLLLLIATVTILALILYFRKDMDTGARKINLLQLIYAVIIVAWAVEITFTGSRFYNSFDDLVYVTIVIIVPVFCFLSPAYWTPIQLLSSGYIFYLASAHRGFQGFLINFSVFTIISLVASWSLYRIRYSSYQRQIELEEERDLTRYHACHDSLTDLPNRRSYIEDLAAAGERMPGSGLILAMFDVNGLKHVNDTLGHDAGDELLQGAAECLQKAFSGMGTIYRVGGDEYTGILYGSFDELEEAVQHFHKLEAAWQGSRVQKLSISVGMAIAGEHPGLSCKELETLADDAMYTAKKEHYAGLLPED